MAQLKAVVFDMGGVILRSMDWGPREAQAKRLGITREALENEVFGNRTAALATVGACSEAEHWEAVRKTFGIEPESMSAWRKEFWSGDRMDMELIAWLDRIRPNYKTALLSNAWPEARVTVRQNYPGSLNVFDLVVYSAEVQLAKPDERIYRLVCQRLGVQPEEAVFVDDVVDNIEGARKIGMQGVRFLNPPQVLEELHTLMNDNHQS
jgi:epoxide hydrolase-like predicted phosphatase